jgi:hypothetical protein
MADPEVLHGLARETEAQIAVHVHYNDGHIIDVDGQSLVGRVPEDRGPAQKIVPIAPLYLVDAGEHQLRLDEAALLADVNAALVATNNVLAATNTALAVVQGQIAELQAQIQYLRIINTKELLASMSGAGALEV